MTNEPYTLDRRQVLKGMAAVSGAAMAGASAPAYAQSGGLAPATSINHVNIGVTDVKRATDFYVAVLGAKPQAQTNGVHTITLPGATEKSGSWISLSLPPPSPDSRKGADAWQGKPGIYTHVGFGTTVSPKEFPRIAKEIKQRFPEIRQPNLFETESAGQEIIIFDPDGLPIQLIQMEHNGTLTGYSKTTLDKIPDHPAFKAQQPYGGKPTGLVPAMSINHVNIGVKDLKKAAEFYAFLLGAKPLDSGPTIQTMTLPGARKDSGSWLSLTILPPGNKERVGVDGWDGTPGQYTHVGFGVTMPTSDFPKVADELKKRYPASKPPNLFVTKAAGQEMTFFDPDGTAIQTIQIEHQGTLSGY